MANTIDVVHGFCRECEGIAQCFKTGVASRPARLRGRTPPTRQAHWTVLSCGKIHPGTKQVTM
jgi:hypothetical protein